jgi:hypothetical protein
MRESVDVLTLLRTLVYYVRIVWVRSDGDLINPASTSITHEQDGGWDDTGA